MSTPLAEKLILITRSYDQSPVEMRRLESAGAKVLPFPTIKIVPVEDYEEFDNLMNKFVKFDFLIFTSANAVEKFNERIEHLGVELDFHKTKIVVVGRKTSDACYDVNLPVDIIPQDFSTEGVIAELAEEYDLEDKEILIPGSAIARDDLQEGLEEAGANVTFIPIYDTVLPDEEDFAEQLEILKEQVPDIFVFTSPSSYKNFLEISGIDKKKYFKKSEIAAIGTTTKKEIEKDGVEVQIVPEEFTMEGIVKTIIDRYTTEEE